MSDGEGEKRIRKKKKGRGTYKKLNVGSEFLMVLNVWPKAPSTVSVCHGCRLQPEPLLIP